MVLLTCSPYHLGCSNSPNILNRSEATLSSDSPSFSSNVGTTLQNTRKLCTLQTTTDTTWLNYVFTFTVSKHKASQSKESISILLLLTRLLDRSLKVSLICRFATSKIGCTLVSCKKASVKASII